MLRKIITKVFFLYAALISVYRKYYFRLQGVLNDGKVYMEASVKFDHPVYFQGKGQVILSDNVRLGYWLAGSRTLPIILQPRDAVAIIKIGSGTAIVNGCELIARKSIEIGDNCRIGARTSILDADFHEIHPQKRHSPGKTEPVLIGNNVWVGNEVMILKGVTIGDDAVVGARCVVTKDVPRGAIVVGNPMRIVGSVYA